MIIHSDEAVDLPVPAASGGSTASSLWMIIAPALRCSAAS